MPADFALWAFRSIPFLQAHRFPKLNAAYHVFPTASLEICIKRKQDIKHFGLYVWLARADLVDWSMAYMPLQKDNRCSKQGRTPRPFAAVWVKVEMVLELLTAAASKEAKDVHE